MVTAPGAPARGGFALTLCSGPQPLACRARARNKQAHRALFFFTLLLATAAVVDLPLLRFTLLLLPCLAFSGDPRSPPTEIFRAGQVRREFSFGWRQMVSVCPGRGFTGLHDIHVFASFYYQ